MKISAGGRRTPAGLENEGVAELKLEGTAGLGVACPFMAWLSALLESSDLNLRKPSIA